MLLQSRRVDPFGLLTVQHGPLTRDCTVSVERAPHAAAHFASPILHAFKESGELHGRTCVDSLHLGQMGRRGSA
jgi:hypothetical protein